MLRPWKFSTKEHKLHLVGDTHLHHSPNWDVPLWKQRGYNSSEEHDTNIVKIWNERVTPEDEVIHVGDYIFKADAQMARDYINQLNGHTYYIWGNHNSGTKQLYYELLNEQFSMCGPLTFEQSGVEIYPITYNNKFTFVGNYMYGKIDHVEFVATHYSLRTWDRVGHGSIQICGHSHHNDAGSNPDCLEGKRLDVGIENFGGPIEFYDAMKIFNKKKIVNCDHHNHETTSSSF